MQWGRKRSRPATGGSTWPQPVCREAAQRSGPGQFSRGGSSPAGRVLLGHLQTAPQRQGRGETGPGRPRHRAAPPARAARLLGYLRRGSRRPPRLRLRLRGSTTGEARRAWVRAQEQDGLRAELPPAPREGAVDTTLTGRSLRQLLLLSDSASSGQGWMKHPEGHREQEQPPDPGPQELSPLNKDAATTAQLCSAEEAEQHQSQRDIARLLQRQEEERKWAQQVEEQELQLQERLEEQRLALEGQHEQALRVLQASWEQEKAALTHSFQEAKAALQDTVAELSAQLEAFQAKMKRVEESILTRDYKKHIQDHGSPSQFWEQELESLHFVIEMKSERIHELDKRLILMETVKEKNLMLEEKITTLQQDNEDLVVQARNQAVVSRQLSEDLLLAHKALEKESYARQQLQQEKEELLYRVLGADVPSTFPLVSVTPTEVSFLAT
ncbi:coiled-coil domain-containing protein 69 isoform X2 [Heterocephalus glaber]|uniref:Coiled-coil domain-containing protein 69 isoform X2 n=1 Tax=Heterocephalus glaber TaxID=10181 RepID=A0AAX6NTR7_HETGA|nr:coiled-coil domain-containing protein 69 isoform X2 [Heterocephalus glaber]